MDRLKLISGITGTWWLLKLIYAGDSWVDRLSHATVELLITTRIGYVLAQPPDSYASTLPLSKAFCCLPLTRRGEITKLPEVKT
jgi:hypothetical protein